MLLLLRLARGANECDVSDGTLPFPPYRITTLAPFTGTLSLSLLHHAVRSANRTRIITSSFQNAVRDVAPLFLALRRLDMRIVPRNVPRGPGHRNQPRFRAARLPDFFSAMRVALRKNETGWLRDSCSGVS